MTRGVYTSEFWISLGATASALFIALGLGGADELVRAVAALAAVVVPAIYTLARTIIMKVDAEL